MAKNDDLLNRILDEEFLGTLAKSTGVASDRVMADLKVIPRAVMSFLISELGPMMVGEQRKISLPFGDDACISIRKNSSDDFTGSFVGASGPQAFQNRSVPGVGATILSTFSPNSVEHMCGPKSPEDIE